MARQRRGGGFRPELRGTLGTLFRTTLQQAGVVKDALERGAREGRARLDDARTNRRRQDALAELGELVLDLIRRGEIDLAELPEAKEAVRFLDHLDNEAAADDDRTGEVAHAPARQRFDERRPAKAKPKADRDDRDDGTVSSSAKVPASRRPGRPTAVWRPRVDTEPSATPAPAPEPDDRPTRPSGTLPRDPHRKGGIRFDSDDDLADYMHPDDVPPKPPTEGES